MRRISLLLLTFLCCYSIYAQDSKWELNAFARPNISNYKGGNEHKKYYNTDWGLEAKFHFNSHLRLVSGVCLATRRYDDNYISLIYRSSDLQWYKAEYIRVKTNAIRVPLKVEYMFYPHNKVRFFFNVGCITNYLISQQISSNDFMFPTGTYTQGKHIAFEEDLTGGIGCEISLAKKLSLYIEPTYERLFTYINGYGKVEVGKANYSYGLQTGLSYRF